MPFHGVREVPLKCVAGRQYANVSLGPGEFSDTHEVSRVCDAQGLSCEHWGAEDLEAPAWEVQGTGGTEGYVITGGECTVDEAPPLPAAERAEWATGTTSGDPTAHTSPADTAANYTSQVVPLPYHLRYGAPGAPLPEFGPIAVLLGLAAMGVVTLWLVLCVARAYRREVGKLLR